MIINYHQYHYMSEHCQWFLYFLMMVIIDMITYVHADGSTLFALLQKHVFPVHRPFYPAVSDNWQYLSGVLRVSGSWIVFGAFGKMEEDHHFLPPPTIFSRDGRMERGPAGENPTWRKCSKHRSPREWRQIRDQSAAYGPSWSLFRWSWYYLLSKVIWRLRTNWSWFKINNLTLLRFPNEFGRVWWSRWNKSKF